MRKFLIALVILGTLNYFTFSQKPTNNPFSRFGVGELVFQSFGANMALGHTGIASYSKFHYTKINPASYSAFGSNHVVFEFAFNNKLSQFVTHDSAIFDNVSDIAYISGLIPITKWLSLSFGIIPYSGIGYTINISDSIYNDISGTSLKQTYEGSGGINQIYIGNSFKTFNNLSLGYNLYYRWGTFDHNLKIAIEEASYKSYTTIKKTYINSGFAVDFGLLYNDTLINSEKRNIFEYTLGAIYSPNSTLRGKTLRYIKKFIRYYSNDFIDTLVNDTLFTYSIPLAQSYGLGLALKFFDQLKIEINYFGQKWKGLSVLDDNNLQNSELYAIGIQYCKDPFSSKYIRSIRYRLGGFYHKTYLNINNTQILHYGITFGIGFPTKSSIINTSFELGTKGTLNNNLFKENYFLFNLDLTIHDIWFIRKKFL